MRDDKFLRTPIRGDHQDRLQNLLIEEAPLAGNPLSDDFYPQTLEISFEVDPAIAEVQIAPLWEGFFLFIPDSNSGNPTEVSEVSEANYPNWSVTGDLILRSFVDFSGPPNLESAFGTHIQLITPIPSIVRYSKIRLSQEFIFTTLKEVFWNPIIFNEELISPNDPEYHQKLVIAFLQGNAEVPCTVDRDDPALDDALRPMPEIVLAPQGDRTVFRVIAASRSEKEIDLAWFDQRPEYDDISGEQLVDPALQTEQDLKFSQAHPNQSVISLLALYQAASLLSYAPDHEDTALPLRIALSAPLSDGKIFRRIELIRPEIPGAPVGASPYRHYPMYQFCWKLGELGTTQSQRMPLSGRLYLLLENGDYDFWVITRSQNPDVFVTGDQVRLSFTAEAPAKYITLPDVKVTTSVQSGVDSLTIYAHFPAFESLYLWEGFDNAFQIKTGLQAKAEADWNADIFDWYLLPTSQANKPYSALYGYIRESAGRHGLAPEFLQTIVWGEGCQGEINRHPVFDPMEVLDAFGFMGLDLILYRTGGKMPNGDPPPIPPEIPASNVEELAEYSYNLVTEGYVDPLTAANVSWGREVVRREAGGQRTLQIANIIGWDTAIELVLMRWLII